MTHILGRVENRIQRKIDQKTAEAAAERGIPDLDVYRSDSRAKQVAAMGGLAAFRSEQSSPLSSSIYALMALVVATFALISQLLGLENVAASLPYPWILVVPFFMVVLLIAATVALGRYSLGNARLPWIDRRLTEFEAYLRPLPVEEQAAAAHTWLFEAGPLKVKGRRADGLSNN